MRRSTLSKLAGLLSLFILVSVVYGADKFPKLFTDSLTAGTIVYDVNGITTPNSSSGDALSLNLKGGNHTGGGNAGGISGTGGNASGGNNSVGGGIDFVGGSATGITSTGGQISVAAGNCAGHNTGPIDCFPGDVTFTSGVGGSGSPVAAQFYMAGGGNSTDTGNLGDITLTPGSNGAGTNGKIYFQNAGEGTANNVWKEANSSGGGRWGQVAYSEVSGTPTLRYQTVQSNASDQTQRDKLNFSTNFSLSDSSSPSRTTVDLAATIVADLTGTASKATTLQTSSDSSNATFYPTFTNLTTSGTHQFNVNSGLNYNPSTNTLTATTFSGALSGNATTATSATNATNATNVGTTAVSTNASYYPLFVSSSSNGNQAVNLDTTFTYNPSTDTLTAATFVGALTGNASTASALAADPADCASNRFATAINASGTLTCAQVGLTAAVTGILPLANGGSGADLSATGGTSQVLKQTSAGGVVTVARLACSDLSNSATSCSTDATNAGNISAGTLAVARGGTGTGTYALGDTLYSDASNSLAKLAGNTTSTSKMLVQTGTGSVSAAPGWQTDGNFLTNLNATNLATGTAPVTRGGSGAGTFTAHGVLLGNGTSAFNVTAAGSAGQVLQSGGSSADPTYSTPTYPSTSGTTGTILRSDGTNNVYTTATYPNTASAGTVLAAGSSNTITGTATPTLGVAATTAGTLTLANATGAGNVTIATTSAASSYTLTFPSSGGTNGYALTTDGSGTTSWTSVLTNPATAAYDTLYQNSGNTALTKLTNGTTGQYLKATTSGAPSWATLPVFTQTLTTPLRVEYALVTANCTTGTCTSTKSGGISSVTWNSAGNYTVNFSPSFSANPACSCSGDETGVLAGMGCGVQPAGGAGSIVAVLLNGTTATNGRLSIICVGPN